MLSSLCDQTINRGFSSLPRNVPRRLTRLLKPSATTLAKSAPFAQIRDSRQPPQPPSERVRPMAAGAAEPAFSSLRWPFRRTCAATVRRRLQQPAARWRPSTWLPRLPPTRPWPSLPRMEQVHCLLFFLFFSSPILYVVSLLKRFGRSSYEPRLIDPVWRRA